MAVPSLAMSRPHWLPPIHRLKRVVPVEEMRERDGGGSVIVTSIELWEGSVAVNYVLTAVDFADRSRMFDVEVSLTDNLGTQYRHTGGGGGGGGHDLLLRFNSVFTPTVPENATTVWIAANTFAEPIAARL